MSAPTVVDPCYCDRGDVKPHTYGRRCRGNGLIKALADFLDRLDAGDPVAIRQLQQLLDLDDTESEPLLSREQQDDVDREIREMERIRSQGAAKGAGYWIGGGSA